MNCSSVRSGGTWLLSIPTSAAITFLPIMRAASTSDLHQLDASHSFVADAPMISIGMEQAPDAEANQKREKRSGEPRRSWAPSRFVGLAVRRRDARRKCRQRLKPRGPSQSILLDGSLGAAIDSPACVQGRPRWTSECAQPTCARSHGPRLRLPRRPGGLGARLPGRPDTMPTGRR
jgi:hypothetical protein